MSFDRTAVALPDRRHRRCAGRIRRGVATLVAALTGVATIAAVAPAQAAASGTADPVAAADAGALTTTLVPPANHFPDGGSSQRAVVRDCGRSTPLPDGQSLWVFCDTVVYDDIGGTPPALGATVRFVPSGTAALTTTSTDPSVADPVALHEADYPGLPKAFITSSGLHGTDRTPTVCPSGGTTFAWTKGLVTLPGTGTAVAFFQDHCPEVSSGFPEYDMGVAEYTASASGPTDFSSAAQVQVGKRYDSVLVNPTPGSTAQWSYGQGAVVDGSYIYLYGLRPGAYACTSSTCSLDAAGAVTVARVPWANGEYRDGSNYRYYTGSARAPWSADPADAVDVLPDGLWPAGDGLSVSFYPQLGRYVMAHADSPVGSADGASLRTAPTPWGPWTAPVKVVPSAGSSLANPGGGCNAPTTCRTFLLHPELTPAGGSQLYLSYVRNNDLATAAGEPVTLAGRPTMQVRLASAPLSSLPAPAPDTQITSGPADPTSSASASFTFATGGRLATPGDPSSLPPAVPGPVTYSCSLDGGTPTACPATYSGLAQGTHTLAVTAVNGQGAPDPTPATWTWTVDRTAPDTTLTSGPASPSNPGSSTFAFTGSDDRTAPGQLAFRCSLDGAPAVACTSPWTAASATTGSHTVAVAAVDRAGNVDPTPATWSWTVDTNPVIDVTYGPPAYTTATSASVQFAVSDDHTPASSLAVACSLDEGTAAPCTSPVSFAGLAVGPHDLVLQTTDSVGNVGVTRVHWIVDGARPVATPSVDGAPATSSTTATVILAGTDDYAAPGELTFRCGLDGAGLSACTSPTTYSGLADGPHSVTVKAVDPAGRVSDPVTLNWTVDRVAPTASLSGGPGATTDATTANFTVTASDDVTPAGSLAYTCVLDGAPVTPCGTSLSLSGLRPGPHMVAVQVADQAGNRSDPASAAWTVGFSVASAPPPTAFTGVAYSHRFRSNLGDDPAVTFAITSGALPPAFLLYPDGTLVGTPGVASVSGPVTVTATSPWGTASQTFTFTVKATTSITGTVRNRVTGAPVGGLRVRAFTSTGLVVAETTTAADGTYGIAYLRPDAYRLSYVDTTLQSYLPAYSGDTDSLDTAATVTVADGTTATRDATVEPLTTLVGTVTDEVTGAPLAGSRVVVFDRTWTPFTYTTTAADGTYRIPYLRGGRYWLFFGDPTMTHFTEYLGDKSTLISSTPLDLAAGGEVRADAALEPHTLITGTVRDDVTGALLRNMNVTLYRSGSPYLLARTDAYGVYRFRNLHVGDYSLRFGDPTGAHATAYWGGGAEASSASPIAAAGGTVTADVRMVPQSTVTGRVTADAGGALQYIWVTLYDDAGNPLLIAATNADGWYRFEGLPLGTYRLGFSDPLGATYKTEYWNNATTKDAATPVVATSGGQVAAYASLSLR